MDNEKVAQLVHIVGELDRYHTRGTDPLEDNIVQDGAEIASEVLEDLAEEAACVVRNAVMENPINYIKVQEAEATFLSELDEDPYLAEAYAAFYGNEEDAILAERFARQASEEQVYEQGFDEGYAQGRHDKELIQESGIESWEGTHEEVLSREDIEAFADDFDELVAAATGSRVKAGVGPDVITLPAPQDGESPSESPDEDEGEIEWVLIDEEAEELAEQMVSQVATPEWSEKAKDELREFVLNTMTVSDPPVEEILRPVAQSAIAYGLENEIDF